MILICDLYGLAKMSKTNFNYISVQMTSKNKCSTYKSYIPISNERMREIE